MFSSSSNKNYYLILLYINSFYIQKRTKDYPLEAGIYNETMYMMNQVIGLYVIFASIHIS